MSPLRRVVNPPTTIALWVHAATQQMQRVPCGLDSCDANYPSPMDRGRLYLSGGSGSAPRDSSSILILCATQEPPLATKDTNSVSPAGSGGVSVLPVPVFPHSPPILPSHRVWRGRFFCVLLFGLYACCPFPHNPAAKRPPSPPSVKLPF